MSKQQLEFFSQSKEEKPLVILISDEINLLVENINLFLLKNEIDTIFFSINDDFKQKYEELLSRNKEIYKIIFVYGFNQVSQAKYQKVFSFLEDLADDSPPLIALSSYTSSLNLLDNFNPEYDLFLDSKRKFINEFIDKFPQALFFLAQDVIVDNENISYPLKLFLTAINKNYLIDPQVDFFWQSEASFFNLIKKEFIRPHKKSFFLVKGKKEESEKIFKKIENLYRQYFQKDLKKIKLFVDQKNEKFLDRFKIVSFSQKENSIYSTLLDELLDQKIRLIPKNRAKLDLITPNEKQIVEALGQSKKKSLSEQVKTKKPSLVVNNDEILLNKTNAEKTSKEKLVLKENKEQKMEDLIKIDKSVKINNEVLNLFSKARQTEKTERTKKKIKTSKKILSKSRKRSVLFYGGAFTFITSLLIISFYFVFDMSKKNLSRMIFKEVKQEVSSGSSNAENIVAIQDSSLYSFFDWQFKNYEKVFDQELLKSAKDIKDLSQFLTDSSGKKLSHSDLSFALYENTLNREGDLKSDYEKLDTSFLLYFENMMNLSGYLSSLNTKLFSEKEKTVWEDFQNLTQEELKTILMKQRFSSAFSEFILTPGKKTILFLVQDSSQLRSTGGVLEKALILTFEDAYLLDKQLLDVEEIDREVYGERPAYPDLKFLLAVENLSLKNSNWLADFEQSNKDITWFIEQARGLKIDLTVLLNSHTFSNLFKLNENELDFENSELFLDKPFAFSSDEFTEFIDVLVEDLEKKEVFVQSNDLALQKVIEANVWAGKKLESICPSEFQQENCFLDSIYQVENNVGENSVNSFVSEKIEHNLGIGRDFVRHKHKILYKNSSSESGSQAVYKNYLQFYLPKEARVESIMVEGKKVDSSLIAERIEGESKVVSILLNIKRQSEFSFEMIYLIKNQMNSPFSYVFLDQKQAGIKDKETTYNIVFDEIFKPQLIAPKANYEDQIINFSNDNEDHFLFAVSFS